jgi:lysozyme family protein
MNYDLCYAKVMKHEGGYANNSLDYGGETYCGISRRFFPHWQGWGYIDHLIDTYGEIKHNTIIPELAPTVKKFYRKQFWNNIQADHFADQSLACTVFDTAVNCGIAAAGRFLQKALNACNNRQKIYPDLIVDGAIGNKTIAALNSAVKANRAHIVHNAFTCLRGCYYLDIMQNDESQEAWAFAWLNRLWISETKIN